MGMAASQARLLTITARMHDIEYQAQTIQNAKVQLATQSDEVYQEYLDALDATTLTVKNLDGERITANFNNLFGKNAVETGNKYALKDQYGRLIVPQDVYEEYQNFMQQGFDLDSYYAYEFALNMISPDGTQTRLQEKNPDPAAKPGEEWINVPIEEIEEEVYKNHEGDKSLEPYRKTMDTILNGRQYEDLSEEEKDKYDKAENAYRNKLYQLYGAEIYCKIGSNAANNASDNDRSEEDFNLEEFTYYLDIFKQIELSGGCVSIEDFDGPAGDASTDSEWLQNQIKCGKFIIDIVNKDRKTGEISFLATAVSSDTYIAYTNTSSIDKTALAKAEAKYEHDTKLIDQKDKKFDMDLSKLETEREALKKQYESFKKVVSENIERTFGLFS